MVGIQMHARSGIVPRPRETHHGCVSGWAQGTDYSGSNYGRWYVYTPRDGQKL